MMEQELSRKSEAYLRSLIEKQNIDVLFECFAILMARTNDIPVDNIHVLPIDNHKRNYNNDIIPAPKEDRYDEEHYFEQTEGGLFSIYTSRSSILDYLPEDLYVQPDNTAEFYDEHGQKRSAAEIEKFRDQIKEQVKSANRFFKPLEVEYNKVRIHREYNEIGHIEGYNQLLETLWDDFPITNENWRRFIRTLHLIPNIIGDAKKTEALIEYVLDAKVSLIFEVEESVEITDEERKALLGDQMVMGFNMTIGNIIYDYLDVCLLRLEGISTDTFFKYYDQQSEERRLINEIIKHYFPLDLEVRLDFSIDTEKDDADAEPMIVLGFSSRLGN